MLICQHVQDRNSRLQQALLVSQLDLLAIKISNLCNLFASKFTVRSTSTI